MGFDNKYNKEMKANYSGGCMDVKCLPIGTTCKISTGYVSVLDEE